MFDIYIYDNDPVSKAIFNVITIIAYNNFDLHLILDGPNCITNNKKNICIISDDVYSIVNKYSAIRAYQNGNVPINKIKIPVFIISDRLSYLHTILNTTLNCNTLYPEKNGIWLCSSPNNIVEIVKTLNYICENFINSDNQKTNLDFSNHLQQCSNYLNPEIISRL